MPKHPYLLPNLNNVHIRNRGHLPHWEMPNAVYSITFRLADSLPIYVVDRLREERAALRRRADTAIDRIALSRFFARRIDEYLDSGSGACHLHDERIARIVAEALRYFDGSRYELIA